ncbi:MAG: tetratricopeptide repeat protein [Nitrospirae bacterium]|nr:MAG: tetratricopeptide repeat protein [Nitrospirota bacterium]
MTKIKGIYYGFLICAFFLILFSSPPCLAEVPDSPVTEIPQDIYEARLDSGLKNTEPYSYILIKKAQADPAHAKQLLTEAIRYSPNLPAAYFEMARISFSFSPDGIFAGLNYVIEGIRAYKRNFWWLVSIAGLSFISLISSFIVVLLAITGIRFFTDSPLLSHDIMEDKKKALLILSLIPLSLAGPLFFIAGAIFLSGLYFSKVDKAVVYASILFLLLSPFFLGIINTFLSTASPELRAAVAVNESRDNKHAISVLKDKNDFVSLFSYGLALKREGRYEEAIAVYKNILSVSPDSQVYVNLGNCYYAVNDASAAMDSYKKSLEIKPLVTAYYNLSLLSREKLDFPKGEEYFIEATKLNREAVSSFAANSKRNPNRLVVDETLPLSILWKYAAGSSQKLIKISWLNSALTALTAIVLLILFYIIDARVKNRAYRCKRCNTILCGKCGKEQLWGQMCAQCYKSLVKFDGIDSRVRVAKLLEVQELQAKKRNMVRMLSFTLPGIAHIYAGKILTGSLFLWPFLFLLTLILLNPFFHTGLSLFSHVWLTVPATALMVLLFLISGIVVRRRLSRGWL